jgi:hypothetical protein
VSVISVAEPITEAQEAAVLEAATAGPTEVEMIKEKKEEGAAPTAAAPAGKGEKAPAGAEKAPAAGAKAGATPAAGAKAPAAAAPATAPDKGADKKPKK